MKVVDATAWRSHWKAACESGFTYFDFLTAVDRGERIEVLAHALDLGTSRRLLSATSVDADVPQIDSISTVFAGASWHERETAEMFGVTFVGLLDTRPLLLRTTTGRAPLLKSSVLAARAAVDWPGADGPDAGSSGRRRVRPPGAPSDWLEDA